MNETQGIRIGLITPFSDIITRRISRLADSRPATLKRDNSFGYMGEASGTEMDEREKKRKTI